MSREPAKLKSAPPPSKGDAAKNEAAKSDPAKTPAPSHGDSMARTIRETIESIVIAFVLAFLFRTFEAEAFVIPTGSMAPTLQGRHRNVECPKCHYWYRSTASSEVNESGQPIKDQEVTEVTCPMCRFPLGVDPRTESGDDYPAYNGDRILVAKFPYDLGDPERWDVVVFHFPYDAKINYIKRLVGKPNETIRIKHGNLFAAGQGEEEFHILRKPPAKVRAMAQIAYDNDYVSQQLLEAGWPERWQAQPTAAQPSAADWLSTDERGFRVDANGSSTWLRYRHTVPGESDWRLIAQGKLPADYRVLPELITDFYAYDSSILRDPQLNDTQKTVGLHWVGELMMECELDISFDEGSDTPKVVLDLVEGGVHCRCSIDAETGKATLSIDGLPDYQPTASTSITGPGTYRLAFSNFDDELLLWVNDKVVEFDAPTTYAGIDNQYPQSTPEDEGDLAPAGIQVEGMSATVRHLRVLRDIYYIATDSTHETRVISDYLTDFLQRRSIDDLRQFWSTPSKWTGRNNPFDARETVTFELAEDQFFVLGDNSPQSSDARLWKAPPYVERKLLIGKALFIYWPASYGKLPGTNLPFPFFPNFSSMGFVR